MLGEHSIEYVQHVVTGAAQKLIVVGRYEDCGFNLKKVRPKSERAETLVFAKIWGKSAVCTDLPLGGVQFTVDWPYHDNFKNFAAAKGIDLIVAPRDHAFELAMHEYTAEMTRNEGDELLVAWEEERRKLSDAAEVLAHPFSRLSP